MLCALLHPSPWEGAGPVVVQHVEGRGSPARLKSERHPAVSE